MSDIAIELRGVSKDFRLYPDLVRSRIKQALFFWKTYYSEKHALSNINLTIRRGEIVGVIGPNGAGKTTTFNLISGMFTADSGTVQLHGRTINQLTPNEICQQGLTRSFQITNLFKGLTIYENLRLSVQGRHPSRFNFWA